MSGPIHGVERKVFDAANSRLVMPCFFGAWQDHPVHSTFLTARRQRTGATAGEDTSPHTHRPDRPT
eukprot:4600417-Prymnesium_polylepis.2